MLHQTDILRRAVARMEIGPEGPKWSPREFRIAVDDLYGPSLPDIYVAPPLGAPTRRTAWDAAARTNSRKAKSQVETRIVDVTLGDVLTHVYVLPDRRKVGWLALVDALTGKDPDIWNDLTTAITRAGIRHGQGTSGYFWSSMLAATRAAIGTVGASPSASDIEAHASTDQFAAVRYPRARSGKHVQQIDEMHSLGARTLAAKHLAGVIGASRLPSAEKEFLVAMTGAVVSPDLWRHPMAVRHCLLLAVEGLRVNYNRQFSLDFTAGAGSSQVVEDLIAEELQSRWLARGAW